MRGQGESWRSGHAPEHHKGRREGWKARCATGQDWYISPYPVSEENWQLDNLAVSAQGFRRGANRVRKQMWYVPSPQTSEFDWLIGGKICECESLLVLESVFCLLSLSFLSSRRKLSNPRNSGKADLVVQRRMTRINWLAFKVHGNELGDTTWCCIYLWTDMQIERYDSAEGLSIL